MSSTSYHLGYLLEIQGDTTCFTSNGETSPPTTWSQTTFVEAIIDPPPIQSMTVELFTGEFGNSGMTISVTDIAAYMNERSASTVVTTLGAQIDYADTVVTVASTTGFSSPTGTIWINQEAITYTGTTATTFTGCSRGAYATVQKVHKLANAPANLKPEVFGYNPTWLGRKVFIKEFTQSDPSTGTTIFTGYIDGATYSDNSFVLDVISVAQRLEEQSVATGLNAAGIFRTTADNDGNVRAIVDKLGEKKTASEIYVQLDDRTQTFPHDTTVTPGKHHAYEGWVEMGSEIIKYRTTAYPGVWQYVIASGSDAFGPYIELQWKVVKLLRVGDTLEFEDSATGNVVRANITKFDAGKTYHSGIGWAPTTGQPVVFPGLQMLANLERGQGDTKPEEHEPGAEVKRVHIAEGDHVDVVLQLLHSGSGETNTYNVLDDGLGAGLPQVEINTTSNQGFDNLRAYSTGISMVLKEPKSPKELLVGLAQLTGGRIFISPDGKITARRDYSPYPDTGAAESLDLDDILGIPDWNARIDQVYNQWSWKTTQNVTLNFTIQDSVHRYGARSLPAPPEDLLLNNVFASTEAYAVATLLRHAHPAPEISVSVPEESSVILEPGQLVEVTLPHLPDLAGSEGLSSALFEVIEYAPSGESVSLRLVMLPQQGKVGLLGPAGIITSKSGNDLVIDPQSSTHLAPGYDRSTGPLEDILGAGEPGTEDVDWFLAGDTVELIDESTLGGTVTTANMVISSINYTTRTITMTGAVPAWVAAGDFIRLDNHTTVKASSTTAKRIAFFTWWANSTPEMLNADPPYVWGI